MKIKIPTTSDVCEKLSRWYLIVYRNTANDKDELEILEAFQSADASIPTSSTELPVCHKDQLT
ncbi:24122_t:CDS:2, partial [Racocetra persica]